MKWYTCARCDAGYDSGPLEQECTCDQTLSQIKEVVPIDDATCGACHGTGYLRGFLNEEGHLVLTGREGDETICTQCGGPALEAAP